MEMGEKEAEWERSDKQQNQKDSLNACILMTEPGVDTNMAGEELRTRNRGYEILDCSPGRRGRMAQLNHRHGNNKMGSVGALQT
jgi:hypothetical protein